MKQDSAAARTGNAALWPRFTISAVLLLLLSGLIPAARAGGGIAGEAADMPPAVADPAD